MKILYIHNRYKKPGGEDILVEAECKLMKENGHEVQLIDFKNKIIKGLFSKIFTGLLSIYNFNSSKILSATLKNFKPDIIHIHNLFFIASPSVLFAAKKRHIPVIMTLHNYRLICANGILLRNNKICELCTKNNFPLSGIKYKCYRNSTSASLIVTMITGIHKALKNWNNKIDYFITLTAFSRSKHLNSSLNIPESKMITLSNFVSDPGVSTMPRDNFYLFIGRIVDEKGVFNLVNVFASLPEKKIVIIGEGPGSMMLEKFITKYKNIEYKGQQKKENVINYLKRCRALICPSIWYEGAPLTIIEAFATGTPVLASNLGSMSESIINGYNGLHFEAGNENDLRSKIDFFDKQYTDNNVIYNNARNTFNEKYNSSLHYANLMKIYNTAISTKK